jgi:hypothetical protein
MSAGAELQALVKKHPVSAAAVLVAVACGVVLYLRSSTIAERTEESTRKSEEAAKMQANITSATGLPEQVEAMKVATKEVEARLVRASQLAINLQYFYKIEAESGVKILDVRQNTLPTGPRPGPRTTYTGVPYTVSVQGTFAQTLSFLKRIESGRHFSRFLSVSYTKSGGTEAAVAGELMNLTINLELLGQP